MRVLKSTSRAVPDKRYSHQIPAGLKIWRKFVLAWRYEQLEEHLGFDNCLICVITVKVIALRFNKIACNCIIYGYLQYRTDCHVILDISIFTKGVPFLCQAG